MPFATAIPVLFSPGVSLDGMTPEAVQLILGMAEQGARAGLDHIELLAGQADTGHVSHYAGTEWDVVGVQPDGSRWTQDQRVAVASGAQHQGANRFGFYSAPGGRFVGNSLHVGLGPEGRNQNATWGYGGATSGDASRAFTHPGEAAFATAVANQTLYGSPGNPIPANGPVPPRPIPDGQPQGGQSMATDLLRRGARGDRVRQLQQFLKDQGIDPGPIDGIFGPRTERAVRSFQQQAGVGVDGVVGPQTRGVMGGGQSRPSMPNPNARPGRDGPVVDAISRLREGLQRFRDARQGGAPFGEALQIATGRQGLASDSQWNQQQGTRLAAPPQAAPRPQMPIPQPRPEPPRDGRFNVPAQMAANARAEPGAGGPPIPMAHPGRPATQGPIDYGNWQPIQPENEQVRLAQEADDPMMFSTYRQIPQGRFNIPQQMAANARAEPSVQAPPLMAAPTVTELPPPPGYEEPAPAVPYDLVSPQWLDNYFATLSHGELMNIPLEHLSPQQLPILTAALERDRNRTASLLPSQLERAQGAQDQFNAIPTFDGSMGSLIPPFAYPPPDMTFLRMGPNGLTESRSRAPSIPGWYGM